MYIKEKIEPLKNMAFTLWENKKVDVVQTTHDMDDPWYNIYDVGRSENIYYNPFALMFEVFYEKFPEGYFNRDFAKAQITKIAHKGVYIEQTDRIVLLPDEITQAEELYEKAVDSENAGDFKTAVSLYEQAASVNCSCEAVAQSLYWLAIAYLEGNGVDKDHKKAKELLNRSWIAGSINAAVLLYKLNKKCRQELLAIL